jgi:hypothetical protein
MRVDCQSGVMLSLKHWMLLGNRLKEKTSRNHLATYGNIENTSVCRAVISRQVRSSLLQMFYRSRCSCRRWWRRGRMWSFRWLSWDGSRRVDRWGWVVLRGLRGCTRHPIITRKSTHQVDHDESLREDQKWKQVCQLVRQDRILTSSLFVTECSKNQRTRESFL